MSSQNYLEDTNYGNESTFVIRIKSHSIASSVVFPNLLFNPFNKIWVLFLDLINLTSYPILVLFLVSFVYAKCIVVTESPSPNHCWMSNPKLPTLLRWLGEILMLRPLVVLALILRFILILIVLLITLLFWVLAILEVNLHITITDNSLPNSGLA